MNKNLLSVIVCTLLLLLLFIGCSRSQPNETSDYSISSLLSKLPQHGKFSDLIKVDSSKKINISNIYMEIERYYDGKTETKYFTDKDLIRKFFSEMDNGKEYTIGNDHSSALPLINYKIKIIDEKKDSNITSDVIVFSKVGSFDAVQLGFGNLQAEYLKSNGNVDMENYYNLAKGTK